MLLEEFKKYCLQLNAEIIVQKYLIERDSYFFQKIQIGKEFEFKKNISEKLDVHIRDIVIVGSGKLGFSLKPEKNIPGLFLFNKFDTNRLSDLDVAIVSSPLFDIEIKNLYTYTSFYKELWEDRNSLAKYVLKGKIATRFLPLNFNLTKNIQDLQEKYKMELGRDVNFEIYKSWYYFETYHKENIKNIQINLIR